jgi:hypothetical protein
MKEIIELINKNFDKDFDSSDYKKVDLFSIKNPNSFQLFLIKDRIRIFQKLFVLDRLCKDEQFFIGCEKLFYEQHAEDIGDTIEVGPCIVLQEFSKEAVFDKFISGLGVAQIDAPSLFNIFDASLDCENNIEKPSDYHIAPTQEVVVSESVFIGQDGLWFRDAEKAKEMLAEFDSLFNDFIIEQADPVSVPHTIYVDWLLKWFPGKIRIRTLSYSKS